MNELIGKMRGISKELEGISPAHSTIILLVAADFARVSSLIMGRKESDIDPAFDKMVREWLASIEKHGVVDEIAKDVTLIKFQDILNGKG